MWIVNIGLTGFMKGEDMSLQFVFGNSGSGKSTYLYEKVLEEAEKYPDKNYLIIVPEQFTMATQKELVRLQKVLY